LTARAPSMRSSATPGPAASPTTRRSPVRGRRLWPRRTVPQSDIDLLVLAEAAAQAAHADALAAFFALLWDAGLPVGHAVRSAEECTSAAGEDITVLTALSEARPLVADEHDLRTLLKAIDSATVWPPREYFRAKREEQRVRHARFGDTADNLEPNLKEGPGGLRDIQTLRWMALRVLGARDPQGLIALGQLGADEYATLERERRALARLRYGLHLVANRREERLRFDHQKSLAARLGHVDTADNLAVEQMMQGFYRSAAVVLRINDRLLQRFEEQLEGETAPEPIDAAFELRRGYLAARGDAWPAGDTQAIFDLFATWAAHPRIRGLHSRTARALAESLPSIPAYTDASVGRCASSSSRCCAGRRRWTPSRAWRAWACCRAGCRRSPRCPGACSSTCSMCSPSTSTRWRCCATSPSFASGEPDERYSIAHEVYRGCASRTAAARRALPRHREGQGGRPFRTRRRGCARIRRGRAA
jgi:[protein-PII] uridylyltransferase